MELNDIITISVIGLYTVIYLIIFFVQKHQISELKSTNQSMKDFMSIFDVDEVRKYVEMKGETNMMKAANVVINKMDMKEIATEAAKMANDKGIVKEVYTKQVTEDMQELLMFAGATLYSYPQKERQEIADKQLPKTQRFMKNVIESTDEKI